MSYTHIHLRSKRELELELLNNPEHILHYAKYESFIGSPESLDFIHEKIKSYDLSLQRIRYENKRMEET